jgi:hypothetical protein
MLVLLPMVINYFNGCARACSLDIAVQIKTIVEPSLIFSGLWFDIYLRLPLKKYKIILWKNKKFEDLEDLLILFEFYFVIVKVSLYISIMYYLLL